MLRGTAPLVAAIRPTSLPGLRVLTTDPDPDAGDLLARRFGHVLREARELADVVVIDAPPLLGTDDARTLASLSEGVLLVVAMGGMADPVIEAASVLASLDSRVLGVVANKGRDEAEDSSYGYSSYTTAPAPVPGE